MRRASVAALREIAFTRHAGDGVLTVFPGDDPQGVPFAIARVFTIGGVAPGGTRGDHAHRECTQLVVCLSGSVGLAVDDGRDTRRVELAADGRGVLVPPGLWLRITFAAADALVAVFCDRPFDPADYVRDRAEYLRAAGR